MFCKKCGKEINDADKFCQYCGSPVEKEGEELSNISKDKGMPTETYGENHDEQVSKAKTKKKWVIPLCIAAGVVVLAGTGVFAMNVLNAEKKEPKKEITKEEKEAEVTYPKEITLDSSIRKSIEDFITLLGNTDCKMEGLNSEQGKSYDGFAFLYMSLYNKIPFLNGSPAEIQSDGPYAWKVLEQEVVDYLKNSIASTEYMVERGDLALVDGMVCVGAFDPNSTWTVEAPIIDKITAISESEIKVEGKINYNEMEGEEVKNNFVIVLTANPDSMWGGYTLKSVDKWEEVDENPSGTQNSVVSTEDKQRLTDFLYLLGEIDYRSLIDTDVKDLYENQKDLFGCKFLFFSMNDKLELLKDPYNAVDFGSYWEMRQEQVDAYLLDSVGSSEFVGEDVISASEGFLGFAKSDPPYVRKIADIKIENITTSDNLDICIQGSMNYEDIEKNEKNPVSFQITMRKNPKSIWGGYTLKSIDKWEKQSVQEYKEPEAVFADYLFFLIDAVNSGDYTGAEKVMLKGSALYKDQESLVKRLYSKNTKEELLTWSIMDKEQIDDTHVRLISDEVIQVTYGDGTSERLYQSYAYTCELTEDGWLFTSLSAVE